MKVFLRAVFIICLLITFGIRAQTPASLGISVEAMYNGFELPDGAAIYALATVFITPSLQTSLPVHAGDTVTVDFYTDGHKQWSDKEVWEDEFNPSKNARPGEATPLIIRPAQFLISFHEWANIPEGRHVILLRAYNFHSLSVFSEALHFTVLPPRPVEPVSGTHVLTGKQRPPLKPEQVRISWGSPPPRLRYEVIGRVTARAPGRWSQDVCRAELKRQAAQMGANRVLIDPPDRSDGWTRSITNKVFAEPDAHLAGLAVYAMPPVTNNITK
jgi:hypothetical protein